MHETNIKKNADLTAQSSSIILATQKSYKKQFLNSLNEKTFICNK